ncbi:MAG: M13 family metallopeptidase, partial [Clostridia bacterium]|nr:M13 family metallopeptidase [Clostridia bacterium]
AQTVSSVLSTDLGKIFVKRHFSEEAKKDTENMISKIKLSYKNKIENATWLSAQTKSKALKKLDTMKLKIGYPEQWGNAADDINIKNYDNGGSYFLNICEVCKRMISRSTKALHKPVDKTRWSMAVYEVNAYYNPQNNEIVFPAGILQSPFYDVNASDEQNMGAIGAVIAHEISHAFDSVGSKFDENGNAVNWWTDADRENFNKRCEQFITAYDGIEISKDIKSNGNLTLFENIADVGAISCMLDILSKKENADYQTFFKSWATVWRTLASYECTKQMSNFDVHSNSKIRTNRTLSNFEEFHKAFNIKQGDTMYVSPEQRVSLW